MRWQERLAVLALLALSWLGLWYHEVIRVPESRGITLEATVLMAVAAAVCYGVWLRRETARLGLNLLLGYGLLMLVGGYLSAPPWAVLQLKTGAERVHYQAHVVYALAQLPLVVFIMLVRRRDRAVS